MPGNGRPEPSRPPDIATSRGRGEVVVGLGGSCGDTVTVCVGLAAAAQRGDRLRVVCAYQPPDWMGVWGEGLGAAAPYTDAHDREQRLRRRAGDVLREAITGAVVAPETVVDVRPGRPTRVLLDAAASADELVVGHQDRGALAGVVLGSTALGCVLHAPCPVTVARIPAVPGTTTVEQDT